MVVTWISTFSRSLINRIYPEPCLIAKILYLWGKFSTCRWWINIYVSLPRIFPGTSNDNFWKVGCIDLTPLCLSHYFNYYKFKVILTSCAAADTSIFAMVTVVTQPGTVWAERQCWLGASAANVIQNYGSTSSAKMSVSVGIRSSSIPQMSTYHPVKSMCRYCNGCQFWYAIIEIILFMYNLPMERV